MIKATIFDFGGVVLDFPPTGIENFVSNSLNISMDLVKKTLFPTGGELIEGKVLENTFWENYAHLVQRVLPSDWEEQLREFFSKNAHVNSKVIQIAQALKEKGFLLPLLSNISPFQVKIFKNLNYFIPFDPLLFSCEIGFKKPDPRIFKFLLEKMDLEPQECLFIDDDEQNVNAANNLGLNGIQFQSVQKLICDLAPFFAFDLSPKK
ncbi:HAD family phosphatase [Candidatus Rhabdochlamydia sp. T3358]|uniref:HAD family hydrolase n=1 Tax=Candidatus Rhabdochlamydia sp. T3358 TaxID=2099795 RepID=UPI0010B877C9|nr:HAD family phosphatase [Candidatus Rhabdochlamydia sp. T3358]VHO04729.1 Alpha-D-glucose-1-phosphate phosphatase YihX [Candidatus Rhabdochlamydia sp. T3358]